MRLAIIRFEGFTDGPPIGTRLSFRAGPLSRGTPAPSKMRPIKSSEKLTCIS